jgi:hypothetical protein
MALQDAIVVLLLGGLVAVAVAQARLPRRRGALEGGDADERGLAALERAGADLTREIPVTFHLYFPTEESATDALDVLRDEGYDGAVQPSVDGATWLCFCTRRMTPTRDALRAASARLAEVARPLGGGYDGWEAAATTTY